MSELTAQKRQKAKRLVELGDSFEGRKATDAYFIGLERKESGGPFFWQTGEPFLFSAWNPGEPNNDQSFGDEMVAHAFYSPRLGEVVWNDIPYGYPNVMRGVIEWNRHPRRVPEPSTVLLLGTGLLGIGLTAWRRKEED